VPKAALSETANANGVERYSRRVQRHERRGCLRDSRPSAESL